MPQKKEERKPEKQDKTTPKSEEQKKPTEEIDPQEGKDILDDIEDILEENAEEFVQKHKSKEGQ